MVAGIRRSALRCAGSLALVILALAPANGWGKARPQLVLRSVAPLRTDGQRFVTYTGAGSDLVVRDTWTNEQRTIPLGADCRVDDGSRGLFLVNCSTPAGDATPYVLRAGSGALVQPPGEGHTYLPGNDFFSSIGTQWLAGVNDESGRVVREYMNWHTGRVVGTADEPGDPTKPRGLNSVSLKAVGPAGVYAVFQRRGAVTVSQTALTGGDPLILRVRGHRRAILDQCNDGCSSVTLGPKVITWASTRAHAYVIKTRRRVAWNFRETFALNVGVQQTAKRIYVSVQNVQDPSSGFRVFAIAMPR
jgi:hypothetical protein